MMTKDKHIPPLSKKVRIIIWTAMLTAFLIIGPMILAYSYGYRFDDLENRFAWVKTGGVYIHSNISNANVYIDGEFVKTGGLLVRNTFVQNLKADITHVIEVRKDGYHGWIKKLPVTEGMVTEGRVLMLPTEIESNTILPFIDLAGLQTATETAETIINPNYLDNQILFGLASSTNEETLTNILNERINSISENNLIGIDGEMATVTIDIPDYFLELGVDDPDELDNLIVLADEIAWLEEGNILMYWIEDKEEQPFYYCNSSECKTELILDWDEDILKFGFMPGRNDVWIVMNDSGLWAVEVDDRSTRNVQPIYMGENIDFEISQNNRIIVLDGDIFYELDF